MEAEIKVLEGLVASSKTQTRHFIFELPYPPELDLKNRAWHVLLGNLGVLFCNNTTGELRKLLIEKPNFIELYKEFEVLKKLLVDNELKPTEPILCWLRGLFHALIAEKPNVIECNVVMTCTSSTYR
jgi:hypothetical protein